jgi:hypothetical protein
VHLSCVCQREREREREREGGREEETLIMQGHVSPCAVGSHLTFGYGAG